MNPLQVLCGEMAGASLGPPMRLPAAVGGRVCRPGDGKVIEHGDGAEGWIAAQEDERSGGECRVSEAGERPERMARAAARDGDSHGGGSERRQCKPGTPERQQNGDGGNGRRLDPGDQVESRSPDQPAPTPRRLSRPSRSPGRGRSRGWQSRRQARELQAPLRRRCAARVRVFGSPRNRGLSQGAFRSASRGGSRGGSAEAPVAPLILGDRGFEVLAREVRPVAVENTNSL